MRVAPASKNNPYIVVTAMPPSAREQKRAMQKLQRRSGKIKSTSKK